MRKVWIIVMLAFIFATATSSFLLSAEEEVKKITKEDLKPLLDDAAVVVVDVRIQSHEDGSSSKIKGAVREDPNQVEAWMGKYSKDKTLVFYCA
jgi:rhodanese-related sulfurtransferase